MMLAQQKPKVSGAKIWNLCWDIVCLFWWHLDCSSSVCCNVWRRKRLFKRGMYFNLLLKILHILIFIQYFWIIVAYLRSIWVEFWILNLENNCPIFFIDRLNYVSAMMLLNPSNCRHGFCTFVYFATHTRTKFGVLDLHHPQLIKSKSYTSNRCLQFPSIALTSPGSWLC